MSLFGVLKSKVVAESQPGGVHGAGTGSPSAPRTTAEAAGAIDGDGPAPDAVAPSRFTTPEFDEFGAPEGAFGRFQRLPAADGDDEHARLAC
ncbi:MAG: hypothetical protein AB7P21_01090 [Lautropia sp.]